MAPAGESELLGQLVHVDSAEAPEATLYLPALQMVQSLAAVFAVSVLYLPWPQAVQSALPEASLYVPAAQAVQVPVPALPV